VLPAVAPSEREPEGAANVAANHGVAREGVASWAAVRIIVTVSA
jgi:hypothetical protein